MFKNIEGQELNKRFRARNASSGLDAAILFVF